MVKWGKSGYTYSAYEPPEAVLDRLPAGIYRTKSVPGQWILNKQKLETDFLIRIPGDVGEQVLSAIQDFWAAKAKFAEVKQLYKRGIVLEGPPGMGKTMITKAVMDDLVDLDGLCLIAENPQIAMGGLGLIRKIEPERQILVLMEDIDCHSPQGYDEAMVTLLDGQNQFNNVVYLATTNHINKLSKRLLRYSRFDMKIHVGPPVSAAREAYLKNILRPVMGKVGSYLDFFRMVEDTAGLSYAHLRELVVATYCLGVPYAQVIESLKNDRTTVIAEQAAEPEEEIDDDSTDQEEGAVDWVEQEDPPGLAAEVIGRGQTAAKT